MKTSKSKVGEKVDKEVRKAILKLKAFTPFDAKRYMDRQKLVDKLLTL